MRRKRRRIVSGLRRAAKVLHSELSGMKRSMKRGLRGSKYLK